MKLLKNSKRNQGFTLIELLIVIAIIGILSTVVLAMLSSARNKGKDSSIQREMKSLQSQVAIAADDGNYNGLFDTNDQWSSPDPKIQALLTAIGELSTVHTAGSGELGWAVQVQLTNDASQYFCVDTSGNGSTSTTALSPGDTACPQ
ncbi:MAG: type II secretion system protein [Candidatus Paceibacterota bacterium]|jgi:prepilin-type N-terminal cleavage/methylation domain-containing protein